MGIIQPVAIAALLLVVCILFRGVRYERRRWRAVHAINVELEAANEQLQECQEIDVRLIRALELSNYDLACRVFGKSEVDASVARQSSRRKAN